MSDTENLVAEFEINNVELEAEYELSENQHIDADFVINAAPEKVSQLENDLNYQTKEQVQEAIQAESTVINGRIDEEVARLEDEIEQSVTTVVGSDLIGIETQNQTVTITSKTFVYEQAIASDTWVIEHNLDKYPSVTVVDTAGTVFAASVEYNSNNVCTVYINGATKGKAYLN